MIYWRFIVLCSTNGPLCVCGFSIAGNMMRRMRSRVVHTKEVHMVHTHTHTHAKHIGLLGEKLGELKYIKCAAYKEGQLRLVCFI